jgi:hypothetical protein
LPIVAGLVGGKLWAWKFGKHLDLKLRMHGALVACFEGTNSSNPAMYLAAFQTEPEINTDRILEARCWLQKAPKIS